MLSIVLLYDNRTSNSSCTNWINSDKLGEGNMIKEVNIDGYATIHLVQ